MSTAFLSNKAGPVRVTERTRCRGRGAGLEVLAFLGGLGEGLNVRA